MKKRQSCEVFHRLLLVFLVSPTALRSQEQEPPVLTTAGQVRGLSHSEAGLRPAVRVRGTVTYFSAEWNSLFLHDGRDAVFVIVPDAAAVEFGELIEIVGRADVGSNFPCIVASELKSLGTGKLPAPLVLDARAEFSAELLERWVELDGVVYSVARDSSRCYFSLARSGFGVLACLPALDRLRPLEENRGRRIRFRGMLTRGNDKYPGRIELMVPEQGLLELTPASSMADPTKISPVGLVKWDQRPTFEIRLHGAVNFASESSGLFISDETGHLRVVVPGNSPDVTRGDVVDVHGQVVRGEKSSHVAATSVEVLGRGYTPPPRSTPADEASQHVAELITVEGTLLAIDPDRKELTLRDKDSVFRVHYDRTLVEDAERWSTGSRFRVTGGCLVEDAPDIDFEIDAQELVILAGLPKAPVSAPQTAEKMAIPGALLWTGGAALGVIILLVGVGVWFTRRRLLEQSRFHNSIHEQLSDLSHVARLNMLSEMVGRSPTNSISR